MDYDRDNGREFEASEGPLVPPSSRTWNIRCPFCKTAFRAFVWSICGGGKKCPGCGAMHTSRGTAYPVKGKK